MWKLRSTISTLAIVAITFGPLGTAQQNEPYLETNEWAGFIECGVGTPIFSAAVCSVIMSANDDFLHEDAIGAGIETLIVALDWEANGPLSEDMWLIIEGDNGVYVDQRGPVPIEARVDNLAANGDNLTFRVFVAGETIGLAYQQPFSVYWHEFYFAPAPDGYSALP